MIQTDLNQIKEQLLKRIESGFYINYIKDKDTFVFWIFLKNYVGVQYAFKFSLFAKQLEVSPEKDGLHYILFTKKINAVLYPYVWDFVQDFCEIAPCRIVFFEFAKSPQMFEHCQSVEKHNAQNANIKNFYLTRAQKYAYNPNQK
jgi:hypothetical protein